MRDKLKMNMMGVLGEKIFRDFAESKGAKVKTKTSMYDSEKDFTVDGYTTEVKTQEPYHLKNSFTVKNDQLEKCNKVDLLIFIECGPATFTTHLENNSVPSDRIIPEALSLVFIISTTSLLNKNSPPFFSDAIFKF